MLWHAAALRLALALAALITLVPSAVSAQSLFLPREGKHAVMLEMLKPSFEGVNSDFLSAAYFLSGRAEVSSRIALVGELPYANHSSSQEGTDFNGFPITYSTSSSTIGDFYLGMEARVGPGPIFLELGARPPIASNEQGDAVITGLVSDVTRWDAFLPDVVSIQTAFNVGEVTPSHVVYRLRVSPVLAIHTEQTLTDIGQGGDSPELYALYSFLIGYHGSTARVTGSMSGRALLTEDFGNLGDRTFNQLEIQADFLHGSIRPGMNVTLPLGALATEVPVVVGLNVAWTR